MKLTARQIAGFLTDPPDHIRIFLIFGPDSGLVRERADTLCAHLVDDPEDPFAVSRLSGDDIKADKAALADAMAALSLTGDQRLVRARITADTPALLQWLKAFESGDAPSEAFLVIQAHDLKKSSALRKLVETSDQGAAIACYAPAQADLLTMAEEQARLSGQTLSADARTALGPILEGDQAIARQEIEKLILYIGINKSGADTVTEITAEDIAEISTQGADTQFDSVIDAALLGDIQNSDAAYTKALEAGLSAVGLLRLLQRRIDQIEQAREGGGHDGAIRKTGAPAFGPPGERFKRQLSIWTPARLDHARRLSFEAERSVKRTGAPVEALVGQLLQRLARGAGARS